MDLDDDLELLCQKEIDEKVGRSGCALSVGVLSVLTICLILAFCELLILGVVFGLPLLIVMVTAFILLRYITINRVRSRYASKQRSRPARKSAKEINKVRNDQNVRNILICAHNAFASMQSCLNESSKYLVLAESEFREKAFAPYWDAVREAAFQLGKYHDLLQELGFYSKAFNGDEHCLKSLHIYDRLDTTNFFFPVAPHVLPSAESVVKKFSQVKRMGLTDYQFASIYEHYKTREVLIAGFRTLDAALSGLQGTISHAFIMTHKTLLRSNSR